MSDPAAKAGSAGDKSVLCPYCNQAAQLVPGDAIYGHRVDLNTRTFWRCLPCEAHVGIRTGGTVPLGTLAKKGLRGTRSAAHAAFDPLWKSGLVSRTEAYARLGQALGLSSEACHIGLFNEAQCAAVEAAVLSLHGSRPIFRSYP